MKSPIVRVPASSTAGRGRNLERREENASQCLSEPGRFKPLASDSKWFIFDILTDSKTLEKKVFS